MSETLVPRDLAVFACGSQYSVSAEVVISFWSVLSQILCVHKFSWFFKYKINTTTSGENNPKSRFCLESSQMFIVYYMQGTSVKPREVRALIRHATCPRIDFRTGEWAAYRVSCFDLFVTFCTYIVPYSYKVFWSFKGHLFGKIRW